MLPLACLENKDSSDLKNYTHTYILCANKPFPRSFLFSSLNISIMSIEKIKPDFHSSLNILVTNLKTMCLDSRNITVSFLRSHTRLNILSKLNHRTLLWQRTS
ncbi:hypothetical protein CDIK_4275 [Cucumispora dikerogammari]|nr:hypothetical protein CDIK_4275 [Cucumispora dikerogammari]